MQEKVKITVTQKMIDAGTRLCCAACPIALATKQAVAVPYVEVFSGKVFLFDKENGELLAKADQTNEAKDFIGAFDHGGARYGLARPFSTTLVFISPDGGFFR